MLLKVTYRIFLVYGKWIILVKALTIVFSVHHMFVNKAQRVDCGILFSRSFVHQWLFQLLNWKISWWTKCLRTEMPWPTRVLLMYCQCTLPLITIPLFPWDWKSSQVLLATSFDSIANNCYTYQEVIILIRIKLHEHCGTEQFIWSEYWTHGKIAFRRFFYWQCIYKWAHVKEFYNLISK